ncbi:MAG: 50S ribosomal protein L18 [Thermoleophilia bacterium]
MSIAAKKKEARRRRATRVRSKVRGTAERPRLTVYRSNRAIWAQLIDDRTGRTLASAGTVHLKDPSGDKSAQAGEVGRLLAQRAKEAGIEAAVFDRGPYLYHGRVKALAEGAREGGLSF